VKARLSGPRTAALAAAAAAPLIAAAVTLWLVIPTLLPGVAAWDTAEYQIVGPVLGTAHPTGFPSYVIIGWIASHILPFGDAAYRMNLLQAILAAVAVGGTVAVTQTLTGMRWVALATGLLLAWTKLFWSLSTHADPHMLHLALVTLLFVALLAWERRRIGDAEAQYQEGRWLLAAAALYGIVIAAVGLRLVVPIGWLVGLWAALFVLALAWEAFARATRSSGAAASASPAADPATAADVSTAEASGPTASGRRFVIGGDGWLVVAAFIYGVAVGNHGLALLLPPAIGLFILAVDPRVILRWRTVVVCIAVLAGTVVAVLAELPIRAAMHAPLVYGHPDTWDGFKYVVLGQQFEGSLNDPLGDIATKAGHAVDLLAGWLGPLGYLAAGGLVTSLVRRPRYVLLSGVAAVITCVFAGSYANASIERYYLVPLFVAVTWAGLFAADLVSLALWLATRPARATADEARWLRRAALGLEVIAAATLVFSMAGAVHERQQVRSGLYPGGVSESKDTWNNTWMRDVLAPEDMGGLPQDSVIMGWWSISTTLWYGQKVEGLRPDILIVDDSTRVNDHLGEVWDVFDRYLGKRPVFTIRLDYNLDGLPCLRTVFDIQPYALPGGSTIEQVVGRIKDGPPQGSC
jgi:hypothetical protein